MKSVLLFLAFLLLGSFPVFSQNRTYDGSMNNLNHSDWGKAGGAITRVVTNGYADGVSEPRRSGLVGRLGRKQHLPGSAEDDADIGPQGPVFEVEDIRFNATL